jgi:thioredoxin-like negative regulator of GroEL|tara:strand:+ start:114 stop:485 length:372 start_codon:yes stop_codon:yes gene_type:complete
MSKVVLLLLFFPLSALSQNFVTLDDLDSKKSKGITVIEFWAAWNKGNQVEFLKELKDCRSYRLSIDENPVAVSQYTVSSVPTLLVFDNGIEVARFSPTIMMQLSATRQEIQQEIDQIILKKFQ